MKKMCLIVFAIMFSFSLVNAQTVPPLDQPTCDANDQLGVCKTQLTTLQEQYDKLEKKCKLTPNTGDEATVMAASCKAEAKKFLDSKEFKDMLTSSAKPEINKIIEDAKKIIAERVDNKKLEKFADLQNDLTTFQTKIEKEMGDLKDAVAKNTEAISLNTKSISNVDTRLKTAETTITEHGKAIIANATGIEARKVEIDQMKGVLKTVTVKVSAFAVAKVDYFSVMRDGVYSFGFGAMQRLTPLLDENGASQEKPWWLYENISFDLTGDTERFGVSGSLGAVKDVKPFYAVGIGGAFSVLLNPKDGVVAISGGMLEMPNIFTIEGFDIMSFGFAPYAGIYSVEGDPKGAFGARVFITGNFEF